jgi:hypothetical protein
MHTYPPCSPSGEIDLSPPARALIGDEVGVVVGVALLGVLKGAITGAMFLFGGEVGVVIWVVILPVSFLGVVVGVATLLVSAFLTGAVVEIELVCSPGSDFLVGVVVEVGSLPVSFFGGVIGIGSFPASVFLRGVVVGVAPLSVSRLKGYICVHIFTTYTYIDIDKYI